MTDDLLHDGHDEPPGDLPDEPLEGGAPGDLVFRDLLVHGGPAAGRSRLQHGRGDHRQQQQQQDELSHDSASFRRGVAGRSHS